jgi:hypothetical protein
VDSSLPPAVLKAQLFSLTNVPTERQKIMVKGQTIGDDTWGKVNLTNGLTLLMMGSADPVPELPTEKVKFLEDMTEAQLARHLQYPGGLKNLGKYILKSHRIPGNGIISRPLILQSDRIQQSGKIDSQYCNLVLIKWILI